MKKAKTLMAVIACAVMLLTVVTSAVGFAAAGDDAAHYAPKASDFARQSDGNSYIELVDAASGGVTVTRTGHSAASRDAMSYKALKLDGLHMSLKDIDFSANGTANREIFMFLWKGGDVRHDSSNCIGFQINLTAKKVKFWNKSAYVVLEHNFSSFNTDSTALDIKFAVANGVWQLTVNGETVALTGLPITENIADDGTTHVSFTNADVGEDPGGRKCTFTIASIHGGDQACYEAPAASGESSENPPAPSEDSSEESSGESSEESSDPSGEETAPDMDAVVNVPAAKDVIFNGAEGDTRIAAEDTASGLKITRKGTGSASGNSAIYTKPLALDGLHIRVENIALQAGQTVTIFVNPTANAAQWGFNYGLSLDIRLGNNSLAVSIPGSMSVDTILQDARIDGSKLDIVINKADDGEWQISINGATTSLEGCELDKFLKADGVYVGFADGDIDGRRITGTYNVTVLHGGDTECLSGATAEEVVADLVKAINDLPETDKLTLDNEAAVTSVGDSFKALESILPDYVNNFDELKATVDAAVAKIAALREAADGADGAAVKAVYDLIAAIKVPNAGDKAGVAAFEQAINKAKAAFDALREDLQARVENSGDLDYYALLLEGMKSEDGSDADSDNNSGSSDNKTESGSSKPDANNPDTGVSLPVGVALAAVLAGGALVAIRRKK